MKFNSVIDNNYPVRVCAAGLCFRSRPFVFFENDDRYRECNTCSSNSTAVPVLDKVKAAFFPHRGCFHQNNLAPKTSTMVPLRRELEKY